MPSNSSHSSEGAGLGLRFLKHIERTRVLFHLITLDPEPSREPAKDFDTLMEELRKFDADLASRPMLIGVSKIDLPEVREALPKIKRAMKKRGHKVVAFSSATNEGVQEALQELETLLRGEPQQD